MSWWWPCLSNQCWSYLQSEVYQSDQRKQGCLGSWYCAVHAMHARYHHMISFARYHHMISFAKLVIYTSCSQLHWYYHSDPEQHCGVGLNKKAKSDCCLGLVLANETFRSTSSCGCVGTLNLHIAKCLMRNLCGLHELPWVARMILQWFWATVAMMWC